MTKALLSQQIDAVQFAMWELHLYLDTHPDDISALALFKKYEEKTKSSLPNMKKPAGRFTQIQTPAYHGSKIRGRGT